MFHDRLSLRAGYNHRGRRLLSNVPVPIAPGLLASDVRLPAYDTVRFGIGLKIGSLDVAADLTNAFDKRYFVRGGQPQIVYPGEPRLLSVSVTKHL